jgi:hypothetical protein
MENLQDDPAKTTEKPAESAKVLTSGVLGSKRFDDDVVLL